MWSNALGEDGLNDKGMGNRTSWRIIMSTSVVKLTRPLPGILLRQVRQSRDVTRESRRVRRSLAQFTPGRFFLVAGLPRNAPSASRFLLKTVWPSWRKNLEQEATEETEKWHMFALFSPFPPVCISVLENKEYFVASIAPCRVVAEPASRRIIEQQRALGEAASRGDGGRDR